MLAAERPAAPGATDLSADARRAFGRRVLAVVIDVLVLSLVYAFVNGDYGVAHVTSGSPVPSHGSGYAYYSSSTDVGWAWLTFVWLVYYFGLEALFGATVGKGLVRLRVTDCEGRRPSLRQVVVRNAVRIVDALPIGYLLGGSAAMLLPWRQRLGDRLANTIVLPREAITEPLLTPNMRRRRLALVGVILLAFLAASGAFFYYGRPPLVVQGMANTREMLFRDGVSSYSLGEATWGSGTVTYQITYVTEQSAETCHGRLTLDWMFPAGWTPRNAESFCTTRMP
jgi:uncharacterized RDD family membrane protein YckC